jgi:putative FmdB family regulatory protein
MPTYDYECDACKHSFEEFQSMSDELLKKCPVCKKKKLRRLIGTGAAIIFKGSGFYQTDYRSESYKSAAKADDKAGSTTDTKASDATKPADTTKPADKNGTAGGATKSESKTVEKNAKS